MGAMLRERPVVARVAQTTVMECGFEAQDSGACIKLKTVRPRAPGGLSTCGAMCNSACTLPHSGCHHPRDLAGCSAGDTFSKVSSCITAAQAAPADARGNDRDALCSVPISCFQVISRNGRRSRIARSGKDRQIRKPARPDPRRNCPLRHRYADDCRDRLDLGDCGPSLYPQDCPREDRCCVIISSDGVAVVLREQGSRAADVHPGIRPGRRWQFSGGEGGFRQARGFQRVACATSEGSRPGAGRSSPMR